MVCIGVSLFASILFGTTSASCTYMSISFTKLGKFSFIIFSNRFPTSCSVSSLSGTPMMRMLERLKLSRGSLHYPLRFRFCFSSCSSDWLFLASLYSVSLIRLLALFTLFIHFVLFTIVSL